jgi:gluconate 2-dehydrogenase gamma chain
MKVRPRLHEKSVTRRRFLEISVCGFAGGALLAGCDFGAASPFRFSEEEAQLVRLITEQIIPGDDGPGATDANVLGFIERQLRGFYRDLQPRYRAGLAAVQETSHRLTGRAFDRLDWEAQTRLLERVEAGDVPAEVWGSESPSQFFRMVVDHTMQGFYGSPRHGGNAGFASWRMLELPYPQVVGRNRYLESGFPSYPEG